MEGADRAVLLVEATHNFKGKNNDELCFSKGNIITVTQRDEEDSWWEGTYDGNTGWFPSNYVKVVADQGEGSRGGTEEQHNRALVLCNLLDSEREHISHLDTLLTTCLQPLANNDVVGGLPFSQLLRDLERVTAVHRELLQRLEAEGLKASPEQRVGGVFLTMAGDILTQPHTLYCSHHPRAVCHIQQHQMAVSRVVRDSGLCATVAGEEDTAGSSLLLLTTALSRPFRRLHKYTSLLQELHRHLPEAHKDRGDAHRAAKVMADLAASCTAVRRQKELELEVVTGEIKGWDRGTLAILGEVQTMGSVALYPALTDCYLVLFPSHLVLLNVSPRMSNFIFQSQHLVEDVTCGRLDDTDHYKNAFQITGPGMERLVAVCQTRADQTRWLQHLAAPQRSAPQPPVVPPKAPGLSRPLPGINGGQPPLPPHYQGQQQSLLSRNSSQPASSTSTMVNNSRVGSQQPIGWSLSRLRPAPPLRPNQLRRPRTTKKEERFSPHEEDSIILRVVEAYCAATQHRFNTGPAKPSASTTETAGSDKSAAAGDRAELLDVVHQLRAQVVQLTTEHSQLRQQVTRDRTDHAHLRSLLHQLMPPGAR